jgi:hypothetical protein
MVGGKSGAFESKGVSLIEGFCDDDSDNVTNGSLRVYMKTSDVNSIKSMIPSFPYILTNELSIPPRTLKNVLRNSCEAYRLSNHIGVIFLEKIWGVQISTAVTTPISHRLRVESSCLLPRTILGMHKQPQTEHRLRQGRYSTHQAPQRIRMLLIPPTIDTPTQNPRARRGNKIRSRDTRRRGREAGGNVNTSRFNVVLVNAVAFHNGKGHNARELCGGGGDT